MDSRAHRRRGGPSNDCGKESEETRAFSSRAVVLLPCARRAASVSRKPLRLGLGCSLGISRGLRWACDDANLAELRLGWKLPTSVMALLTGLPPSSPLGGSKRLVLLAVVENWGGARLERRRERSVGSSSSSEAAVSSCSDAPVLEGLYKLSAWELEARRRVLATRRGCSGERCVCERGLESMGGC